jgi:hypothetical protein
MEDCKEVGVAFCDHATSLFKVICVDVHTIHLMRGYESLHPSTILNWVEDDMGCSFKRRNDWHNWMVAHKFVHTSSAFDV